MARAGGERRLKERERPRRSRRGEESSSRGRGAGRYGSEGAADAVGGRTRH